MTNFVKFIVRGNPKWDQTKYATMQEFVASDPAHDPVRTQAQQEYITSLPVIAEVFTNDPDNPDDTTVAWTALYTIMDNNDANVQNVITELVAFLETRREGPFIQAHGYTIDISTYQK